MSKSLHRVYHWLSLAAIVFSAGVLAFWAYSEYTRPVPPVEYARQTSCNAMWLGHDWIAAEHTPEEITELAIKLHDHGVSCVYVHTTPLLPDGSFDTSRAQYLDVFLTTFRKAYPEATLYAWIGILTQDYEGTSVSTKIDLSDYKMLNSIEDTAFQLVDDYGFDGIHLDVEPVESGSKDFLVSLSGLHEGLKARGRKLSIAVIFLATPERRQQWLESGKQFFWSWLPEYYDTVSLFTDQLVIMSYNIGISDPDQYSERIAWHMQEVQNARANGVPVLIGVPTYDGTYSGGENLAAGLEGIRRGSMAGYPVDGYAVYSEWTTDEEEWELLNTQSIL